MMTVMGHIAFHIFIDFVVKSLDEKAGNVNTIVRDAKFFVDV